MTGESTSGEWRTELTEAVAGLRKGRRAVAAVLCVGATESEVDQFLASTQVTTAGQGAPVEVKLRKYDAEEYDFDWDEGVEVVLARFPEFIKVYSRLKEVPDGILRRTLVTTRRTPAGRRSSRTRSSAFFPRRSPWPTRIGSAGRSSSPTSRQAS
jgi:hypothetical protein